MSHRARGRTGRIAAGLGALFTLFALLVGVPVLLVIAWRAAGPPLPNATDLLAPDDGTVFVRLLTLVGWVGWASFGWAVVAEILAYLRGWSSPHGPVGWLRRGAANLITSVAVMLSSPTITSTVAAPIHAVLSTAPTHSDQTPAAPQDYVEHHVVRGEQLSSLAERYFGDPGAWERIAQANVDLTQPDGRRLHIDDLRIYPGWVLRIPTTALAPASYTVALTDEAVAEPKPSMIYVVQRGDWLGSIAERFLGDFEAYHRLADLNPALEAKDHRFPDHIEAGWRITLPAEARDRGPLRHAAGALVAQAGSSTSERPQPNHGAPPEIQAPVPPPPSPSVAPTTAPPATSPADTAADSPDGLDIIDDGLYVVTGLTGAGLLATLVLRAVRDRRRRQQHHRRPRRRTPQPRGGMTERDLRAAEQPADVDRLDAALRHLAANLIDRDVPDIVAVRLVDGAVSLVLSTPCQCPPPVPWVDDGHRWLLPPDTAVVVPPDAVAALPALVAVGSRPGTHVLLDLERFGVVTIAGDAARADALLRYVAAELACNSWSDEVDVVLAGFEADEADLLTALSPSRVSVAGVAEAVGRARRRIDSTVATLQHLGIQDTFAGRVADLAGDAWMPFVVLVARPTPAETELLTVLAEELHVAGRCAVAVVITGTPLQTGITVNVDAGGGLTVADPWSLVRGADLVAAAGLPAGELAALAEIMTMARAAADVAVPPAAETEPWAQGTDAAGSLTGPPDAAVIDDSSDGEPTFQVEPVDVPVPSLGAAPGAFSAPSPEVTVGQRPRGPRNDPDLDADVRAWWDEDPARPRIAILGPVTVEAPGGVPEQRRRFHAELIVYLAQRGARGADRSQLEDALWPDRQVKEGSLRVAITRARRWLGEQPSGDPWLPNQDANRIYRLAEGYLLDWHLFRRLRSRAEATGSVDDLRAALELVRGVPLDGADQAYAAGGRNPYTWLPESDIDPFHVVSAIADTASDYARRRIDAGDTSGARWAVDRAWAADPYRSDDEVWHQRMRADHLDGRHAELRVLLADLLRARDAEIPEDLSPTTYAWLRNLSPSLLGEAVSGPR